MSWRALSQRVSHPPGGAAATRRVHAEPSASSAQSHPSPRHRLRHDADTREDGLPSSTPPPTPFDQHVHLPLLSAFPAFAYKRTPRGFPLLVPLPLALFNAPPRPALLHRIVVAHLAAQRQGTASTKGRSQVNYSGHKIRPQKGTGSARLGSRGSPMLRGGGRAHGPSPKGPDGWARKVNRKEDRLALRTAVSEKWRSGNLHVVEHLGLHIPKTRSLSLALRAKGLENTLFVMKAARADKGEAAVDGVAREAERQRWCFDRAAANIPSVAVLQSPHDLSVYDALHRRHLVVELDALDGLVARLDPLFDGGEGLAAEASPSSDGDWADEDAFAAADADADEEADAELVREATKLLHRAGVDVGPLQ